ncbi:unnamed protein product, partial [Musa textilis]
MQCMTASIPLSSTHSYAAVKGLMSDMQQHVNALGPIVFFRSPLSFNLPFLSPFHKSATTNLSETKADLVVSLAAAHSFAVDHFSCRVWLLL